MARGKFLRAPLDTLRRDPDITIGAIVALVAVVVGSLHFITNTQAVWPTPPTPVEVGFESAINVALGKGFTVPNLSNASEANAFLRLERDSIDVSHIPPEAGAFHPAPIQQQHIYLFTFIGWLWGIFGISWTVLKAALVAALAANAVLTYAIFRVCISRAISAVLSALFVTAPFTLCMMTSPRDFLRAPFLLGVILLLALLLKRTWPRQHVSIFAISLGALIGIGLGFRHDLLVCVPISLAALAVLARAVGRTLLDRAMDVALFFAAFIMAAAPVLASHSDSGTTTYLHILNGLPTACEDDLGIGRASYERMYLSNANLIDAMAWSYSRRADGDLTPLEADTLRYEDVCRRMLFSNLFVFPADAVTFVYAAFLRISEGAGADTEPYLALEENPMLPWLVTLWTPVNTFLHTAGPFTTLVALGLLLLRNWRAGLSILVVVAYFACYPALEFQWRHVFHMLILPLWASGFLLHAAMAEWGRYRNSKTRIADWLKERAVWIRARALPATCIAFAVSILFIAPLAGAAFFQSHQLDALYVKLRQMPMAPLSYQTSEVDAIAMRSAKVTGPEYCATTPRRFAFSHINYLADWKLYDIAGLPPIRQPQKSNVVTPELDEYLCVELVPDTRPRHIWIRYDGGLDPGSDFTRIVFVAPDTASDTESTRYFFPVYQCPGAKFLGIGLRAEDASALRGIYRATAADALEIWPNITIPADQGSFITRQALFPSRPHELLFDIGR